MIIRAFRHKLHADSNREFMKQTLGGALPMHQYNDSKPISNYLAPCAVLLLCLGLAACTTPAVRGGAATGVATATQPDGRHISDQTLRGAVRDNVPLRYVVQPGDTLWDIADHFMVKPWYWPEIWYGNPQIANPHRIYPGDVLVLTSVNGRPRIRLSPRLRERPVQRSIGVIPPEAINTLLDAPRLVSQESLQHASYIAGFRDNRLLASENMIAYARLLHRDGPAQLDVVRAAGKPLIDPETGEQLGFLAVPIGHVKIMRRADGVGVLRITDSTWAIRQGDHLLPSRMRLQVGDFRLHLPHHAVNAKIIATPEDHVMAGQYDVVIINRGASDGLERGMVLQIQKASRTIADPVRGMQAVDRDELSDIKHRRPVAQGVPGSGPEFVMNDPKITLPPLPIGAVMLFEVDEQTSFGIILEASQAVNKLDRVSAPAQ